MTDLHYNQNKITEFSVLFSTCSGFYILEVYFLNMETFLLDFVYRNLQHIGDHIEIDIAACRSP